MRTETFRVRDLSEDPANVRRHGARNLEALKASLRRFGQQTPIVVDAAGVVRKGNGTLRAARELGWETIEGVRTSLVASEATAYAIADNRTSDLSEDDDRALAAQLQALRSEDEDLARAAGYEPDEVDALIRSLAADDPAPGDEDPGDEDPGDFDPAIRYELVFDDAAQQDRWFRFLRRLKQDDALAAETIAGRVDLYLRTLGL